MKQLWMCAFLAVFLAACAPSTPREIDQPERAIPTQTATPDEAGMPGTGDAPVEEVELIEADTTSETQGMPVPPPHPEQ